MDKQRWQRIDELFHAALASAAAEREPLLTRGCDGDPSLRAEVQSLLEAHERSSNFIELPAFDISPRRTPEFVPRRSPGQRIGRYTLRTVLGVGGMGVVYEAEQDSPRRLVALKVLRSTPVLDELTPRLFAREGQALARLEHPDIAAIHEVGRSEDGCYYFAMERVVGTPLTQHVREHGLSMRARLELFARVCDAVNYAHQRGVIHRDLKPANILVVEQGTPEQGDQGTETTEPAASSSIRRGALSSLSSHPKILDFGLARVIDSSGEQTQITQPGAFQGTLAYASPEQARGRPDQIDVRTDVYSLGVILYEMVLGQTPFDLRDVPLPEAVRRICSDPPRPPRAASRSIDRDLETILLKSLEK